MPIRTRLWCMASAVTRKGIASMEPASIASNRALAPDPRFPVTLVTGRVRRSIRRTTVQLRMRDGEQIPARIYQRPDVDGSAPVVVYYHGGGWTLGRPLDYESLLTMIADETGAVVVAPDYRKAPDHKAPAAVLDAHDTLDLVLADPDWLPVSPSRVVVAGDSAGGNLSALVALRAGAALAGQVLIYPAVTSAASTPTATRRCSTARHWTPTWGSTSTDREWLRPIQWSPRCARHRAPVLRPPWSRPRSSIHSPPRAPTTSQRSSATA